MARYVRELQISAKLPEGFGSWALGSGLRKERLPCRALVKGNPAQYWCICDTSQVCFTPNSVVEGSPENGHGYAQEGPKEQTDDQIHTSIGR